MSHERLRELALNLRQRVTAEDVAARPGSSPPTLDVAEPEAALASVAWRELLESMLLSRHLDLAALSLRERGFGHYTIGSSGHEANVVLGRLTRPSDPSLVHYRSAALQLERARQVPELDGVRDIALSLVASS